MRHRLGTLALLAASLGVAALLAEWALRWRLDEVDYLQPRLESHPVLRHAVVPGSGGHDAWGFRNPQVPERVEILAVGDSQTYGVSAPARHSWPAWLARLSGRTVYNLSMLGYGPPDYRQLLLERGFSLRPRIAVIGFYLGNDLPRSGEVADGRPEPSPALAGRDDPRWLGELRTRLSQGSLLYQVLKFELPGVAESLRFREAGTRDDTLPLEHPVSRTHLVPAYRLAQIDQGKARNRRGLAAARADLAQIGALCRERGVRCPVLLIPTKESVYRDLARQRLDPPGYALLARLAAEEDAVRDDLTRHLEGRGLEWIDPLPDLRRALPTRRLYPANADGHPAAAGYRVIAAAVWRALSGEDPS